MSSYIGAEPAAGFATLDRQSLTGDGGTGYTLDHAVANENEIEVYVNNVRQEPGGVHGERHVADDDRKRGQSTDDFYVVYQGKAIQTSVPGDGTVTTAMLQDDAATAAKVDSTLHLSTIKDSAGTNNAITIDSSGNLRSQKTSRLPLSPAYMCKVTPTRISAPRRSLSATMSSTQLQDGIAAPTPTPCKSLGLTWSWLTWESFLPTEHRPLATRKLYIAALTAVTHTSKVALEPNITASL